MGPLDKTGEANKVNMGLPVAGHKLELREVGCRLERAELELPASSERSFALSDRSVG